MLGRVNLQRLGWIMSGTNHFCLEEANHFSAHRGYTAAVGGVTLRGRLWLKLRRNDGGSSRERIPRCASKLWGIRRFLRTEGTILTEVIRKEWLQWRSR